MIVQIGGEEWKGRGEKEKSKVKKKKEKKKTHPVETSILCSNNSVHPEHAYSIFF